MPSSRIGITLKPSVRFFFTSSAYWISLSTQRELTALRLSTATRCRASSMALRISGSSSSPPVSWRESVHAPRPRLSRASRISATTSSSLSEWEMKTFFADMGPPFPIRGGPRGTL